MSDKNTPLKVEVVRPVDAAELVAKMLFGLIATALTAWGVDALIGALFPEFALSYWQALAAILLARLTFGVPWAPKTQLK